MSAKVEETVSRGAGGGRPPDWSAAREVLGRETLSVILPVHNLGGEIERNLSAVVSAISGAAPRERSSQLSHQNCVSFQIVPRKRYVAPRRRGLDLSRRLSPKWAAPVASSA